MQKVFYTRILAPTLFLLLFLQSKSQTIKGKVIDDEDKKPVPFAVIGIDNTNYGTTTDIDGNFLLTLKGGEANLVVQVIGYEKKIIPIGEFNNAGVTIIKLKSLEFKLLEVVVTPKENPANELIRRVIKNKPRHDIANLNYYLCHTYAKTYFTMSSDDGDENFYLKDTVGYREEKKVLDNSYLFFMESVTEKKYIYKNKAQEKVLSSRVSGFKSAPFGAFASQLQSFTFYNDNVEILGVKYLTPLTSGTFKRYNFEISDTVTSGTDTTILIKYSPRKNANFKGMKGVLYINKSDYALSNVLAEPGTPEKSGNSIRIQQLYQRVDSIHWFPKQANTEVLFNSIKISNNTNTGEKNIMKAKTRLYVTDVKLDSVVKIRNKSIAALNAKDFDKKDEAFWNKYRVDSLNSKELRTYEMIDSLGEKAKIDKKLKWFSALSSGKWQIGYINIDLKHILRANEYEGIRAGCGLSTSNKLSRWFSIGGYGAYGFRDKAFKYGGFAQANLNYKQTTNVVAEVAQDVTESAGTTFLQETKTFVGTEQIRNLLVSKMDKTGFAKASFNTVIGGVLKASIYGQVQQRVSPFGYFVPASDGFYNEIRTYNLNEAGVQLKFWPKEKYTEMMGNLVSMGSSWPAFYINASKGITNTINGYTGTFDYQKVDLRIDHKIEFKVKGFLSYQVQAGKVFGNVPYSVQYNNKGSRTDLYGISAEKSLETVFLNEFVSSQYAALYLSINSGRIIKRNKYFNPEFELVHNYCIGTIDNRERLTNIELNDMSKGFTEAGLRVKNIYNSGYSSFGLGVFYRYGNYAYEGADKNVVFKLVFSTSF